MMLPVVLLRRLLAPSALAITFQQIGRGSPGVNKMWEQISYVFPFSFGGGSTPLFLFDQVNGLVLLLIAQVAVVLVGYAAARLAMAGWNEQGIAEAKRILTNVGIGLVAALVADVLIVVVWKLLFRVASS